MSEHTDKVLKEMGQSPGFAEHVDRTLGWHLEHKRLGFADPIADVYEALLSEKAQLSEEDATFNQKAQQTDFISRQAAIEELERMVKTHEHDRFGGELLHWTGVKAMLDLLPSAQPEPHWIPCSERLPEEMTYVLITDKDGDVYSAKFIEVIAGQAEWFFDNGIIAWMPLPEPYQEDKA